MNKTGWTLAIVSVLIIVAAIILFVLPGQTKAPTTGAEATSTPDAAATATPAGGLSDQIEVSAPMPGATVASPLAVAGKARGSWYFEASFPAELKDASGATIAQGPAQAQGDWMTQEFVPFAVTLSFPAQPAGSRGTLVLHNDNPSGLPQNDKSVEIPVVF